MKIAFIFLTRQRFECILIQDDRKTTVLRNKRHYVFCCSPTISPLFYCPARRLKLPCEMNRENIHRLDRIAKLMMPRRSNQGSHSKAIDSFYTRIKIPHLLRTHGATRCFCLELLERPLPQKEIFVLCTRASEREGKFR